MATSLIFQSLLGGMLIGASASLAWGGARQVAGISGIVGGLLRGALAGGFRSWFLAGLLLTSLLIGRWSPPAASIAPRPLLWLVIAGLLVGFGTQLGGGCTSGHGVCGISRLSVRSLTATGVFVAVGALMVLVARRAFALPVLAP